jgi:hypothetical protein
MYLKLRTASCQSLWFYHVAYMKTVLQSCLTYRKDFGEELLVLACILLYEHVFVK